MKNLSEIKLNPTSLHIWPIFIPDRLVDIEALKLLLSADEIARAKRFYLAEHRERFIVAHGCLRQVLCAYLGVAPQLIEFAKGARGKPYLVSEQLQFNLSHSHDMVVIAVTRDIPVGVDIEKMAPDYHDGVAERVFSEEEYWQLKKLPEIQQIPAFFRLWAAKEALIKVIGAGIFMPLREFSVDLTHDQQTVALRYEGQEYACHLTHFHAHSGYQSAFATLKEVEEVTLHFQTK